MNNKEVFLVKEPVLVLKIGDPPVAIFYEETEELPSENLRITPPPPR